MNRHRGCGSTPYHRRGRSSPSTHSPPANTKPMPVGTDVLSDEAHLEGMGNKSQIHEHTSGGSSTKKIPEQFNVVPSGSSSIDSGKLELVPDPPVEALNRSKHLDGQPGSKFANDHQLSTQSDHMVFMAEKCFCRKWAVHRCVWTDQNCGRRFNSCADYNCNFFNWVDPPLCERARAIIPGLIRRVNALEAEVQALEAINSLEGMGKKSQIHEHTSGGSSTKKSPKQFNEAVPFGSGSKDFGKLKLVPDPPVEALNRSKHLDGQPGPPGSKFANDHQLSTQSDHMVNDLNLRECEHSQLSKAVTSATSLSEGNKSRGTSEDKTIGSEKPFDICRVKTGTPFKLKASLHVQNREKINESKRAMGGQAANILRPGMVLLKNFISCKDQVKIVQSCRKLGLGDGGFYQHGYGNGATMHLKMMCLGKNWDPQTNLYEERRSVDGAEPPPIPSEFQQLVQKAIQDSHAYLVKEVKHKPVESVLPSMNPDICIVNFYTSGGWLDLHKDQDESEESLNRGLPVVSISIGDSAEFLYCDQMDISKAEKVVLESGDVLIFGGKSRHVYHGVTSILSKTAPQALLQESDLRPGRLNLTFRKY